MTEYCEDAAYWINTNNLTSGNMVISISVASSQYPLMRKNQFARYWTNPWALLWRGDHPWKQLTWKKHKVWQCVLIKSVPLLQMSTWKHCWLWGQTTGAVTKPLKLLGRNSLSDWKGKGLHTLSSQIFYESSAGPDSAVASFNLAAVKKHRGDAVVCICVQR